MLIIAGLQVLSRYSLLVPISLLRTYLVIDENTCSRWASDPRLAAFGSIPMPPSDRAA